MRIIGGEEATGGYYANKIAVAKDVEFNPTVRENLDRRIAHLEHELAEAKASKEALAPLLDIKIRDIRRAMDY